MNNKERMKILNKCLEYYNIAEKTNNIHYRAVALTIANELKEFIEEFTQQLYKKEYEIYIKIVEYYNKFNVI